MHCQLSSRFYWSPLKIKEYSSLPVYNRYTTCTQRQSEILTKLIHVSPGPAGWTGSDCDNWTRVSSQATAKDLVPEKHLCWIYWFLQDIQMSLINIINECEHYALQDNHCKKVTATSAWISVYLQICKSKWSSGLQTLCAVNVAHLPYTLSKLFWLSTVNI